MKLIFQKWFNLLYTKNILDKKIKEEQKKLQVISAELAKLEKQKPKPGKEFSNITEKMYGKGALRVVISDEKNKLLMAVVNVKDGSFQLKGREYLVEADKVLFWKDRPYSFYNEGNPKPLNYKYEKSQIDSKTLSTLMRTKFIQDLASSPKELKLMLIVAIIGALASVACFAKLMGWLGQ